MENKKKSSFAYIAPGITKQRDFTLRDVMKIVTEHFKCTEEQLKSKSKRAVFSEARKVFFIIGFKFTDYKNLRLLGAELNRDHASLIFLKNGAADLLQSSRIFAANYKECLGKLYMLKDSESLIIKK